MITEAAQLTPRELVQRANERIHDWVLTRVDSEAQDIARLYLHSRDRLVMKLRALYDTYLAEEPSYVKARTTGTIHVINRLITQEIDQLTDEVGQTAVSSMVGVLGTQYDTAQRILRRHLPSDFAALPVSTRSVLGELTTHIVGGATFFDRLFHIGDGLKRELVGGVRQGLINGEDFMQTRQRLLKAFGVEKLRKPGGPAYGSVKTYKNEARRQWNLLMQQQAEASDGIQIWWAILDPETTPGCLARHGRSTEQLGMIPPRHYNAWAPWTEVRGQFIAGYRLWYDGLLVTIQTRSGQALAVTPNHPVLTAHTGLVPAKDLCKGDHLLLNCSWDKINSPGLAPLTSANAPNKIQDRPATIEQVFRTMAETYGISSRRRVAEDFHGDATCGDGNIDIVVTNDELWDRMAYLTTPDELSCFAFEQAQLRKRSHSSVRNTSLMYHGIPSSAPGPMHSFDDMETISAELPSKFCSVAAIPQLETLLLECLASNPTRDVEFVRALVRRSANAIEFDEVVDLTLCEYHGYVYDLQTENTCIVAQNVITSQCRCTIAVFPPGADLAAAQDEAEALLEKQGYTRKEAMLEESEQPGYGWGHQILQPLVYVDGVWGKGVRFASVPWRQLPRVAATREVAWGSLGQAVATDRPDHVLLRLAENGPEVKTWEGWVSVFPRVRIIETLRGVVDDSAVIQPPWDERVQLFPAEIRERWPGLARITVPIMATYALALVDRQLAEQLTLGTIDPGERVPYQVGEDFPALAMQVFWRQGHPANAQLVVAGGELLDPKMILDIATGQSLYATEDFATPLLAPYVRVAAAILEDHGRIWAIMPRGLSFWALPGGHLELEERPVDAVVREIREEIGLPIRPVRLLGKLYRPWSTTLVFLAVRAGGKQEPSTPDEISGVHCIQFEDLAADERFFLQRHGVTAQWQETINEAVKFDPALHPRDPHGKFVSTGISGAVDKKLAAKFAAGRREGKSPAQILQDHLSASELPTEEFAARLRKDWKVMGQPDTAVVLRVAAAQVWGGSVWVADKQYTPAVAFRTFIPGALGAMDIDDNKQSRGRLQQAAVEYAKAQYARMQSVIATENPIPLYRGVDSKGKPPGQNVSFEPGSLSSWTTSPRIAARFGDTVVQANIHPSQIFSTPHQGGLGDPSEREYMVLGGGQRLNARVVSYKPGR